MFSNGGLVVASSQMRPMWSCWLLRYFAPPTRVEAQCRYPSSDYHKFRGSFSPAAATRFVGLHSLGECTRPIHDTSQDGFDYDRRGRRNYHFLLHRPASLRTHVPIPPRSVDLGLALEAKERVAIAVEGLGFFL